MLGSLEVEDSQMIKAGEGEEERRGNSYQIHFIKKL